MKPANERVESMSIALGIQPEYAAALCVEYAMLNGGEDYIRDRLKVENR